MADSIRSSRGSLLHRGPFAFGFDFDPSSNLMWLNILSSIASRVFYLRFYECGGNLLNEI